MNQAARSRLESPQSQRQARRQPAAQREEDVSRAAPLADALAQSPRAVGQRLALAAAFGAAAAPTVQLRNDQPHDASPLVVQRISKRWKNVLSLGIRKAYVEIKRATQAPQAGPVAGGMGGGVGMAATQQAPTEMDRFVSAYGKSRHYHQTMDPGNLTSIEKHGLLNQTDRIKTLPSGDVVGMTNWFRDSEYQGDEKKGVYLAPRSLIEEDNRKTLRSNFARAYLPSERTKVSPASAEDSVDSQEMFQDNHFGGAVITKASVGPELVTTKDMLELLDSEAPKIDTILRAVASQYDGDPANRPSIAEMKDLLRTAIHERRLSNAALDNFGTDTR